MFDPRDINLQTTNPIDHCLDYTQRNIYNQINNFYDVLLINQDNNHINSDFIAECISIESNISQ